MKKIVCILFIVQFFTETIYSQADQLYSETLQEATEYLLEEDYAEPLYLLLGLEKKGYTFANVDFWIGYCYLHSINNYELAIPRFQHAIKQISREYDYTNYSEVKAPLEAHLYLGDAYLLNNDLPQAKASYLLYQKLTPDPKKKEIAQQRLKECLVSNVLKKNANNCKLLNAGRKINSGIANKDACISGDGNALVYIQKMKFYDALFYTVKNDTGWTVPQNITSEIGSDGNFIPTALSGDGKKMLLESFATTHGYDIYESSFNGRRWTKVKKLAAPINTSYNDNDAAYSSTEKSIVFSSNREGGFGGYDLYTTNYPLVNGKISIENIGNTINTSGNEKSPMLIENDSLLVYNSDILYGMGGFDYYHAQLQANQTWNAPINLGIPFNTTQNDDQLKLTTQKKEGVISRNDPSGYTETDILFLSYTNFGNFRFIPVIGKLQANNQTFEDSAQNMVLIFVDNTSRDTIDITAPDSTGNYSTFLYPGEFDLIIKKDGDVEHTQKITLQDETMDQLNILTNIPPDSTTTPAPATPIDPLPEIKPENQPLAVAIQPDTIHVPHILFGFNKSDLTGEGYIVFIQWLKQLPIRQIKTVRLIGFTDSIGTRAYNITLSLERAKSIKALMVQMGISASLIAVEGKGNTEFIAPNATAEGKDNPEGRTLNRRVEIEFQFTEPKRFIINNLINTHKKGKVN